MNAGFPVHMLQMPRGPRRGTPSPMKVHGRTAVLLRLDDEVLAHIDVCAAANYRSRSAEICARLAASTEGESIDEHGVIVARIAAQAK